MMSALVIIATCLVFLSVMGLIHYLARFLRLCDTTEQKLKRDREKVAYRDPFYASQALNPSNLADRKKSKDTEFSHKSFQLEELAKWKGWSDSKTDEASGRKYAETHQSLTSGCIQIVSVDPSGKFILIANASGIIYPRDEDVSGWEIIRKIPKKRDRVFIFPPRTVIKANKICKIWARGKGVFNPPTDFVFAGDTTWGTATSAETVLMNKGEIQASLHWTSTSIHMESSDAATSATDDYSDSEGTMASK